MKLKAEVRHAGGGEYEIDTTYSPTLRVHLSDGGTVDVELFERQKGMLTVRVSEGVIVVYPRSTNVIEVESTFKRKK